MTTAVVLVFSIQTDRHVLVARRVIIIGVKGFVLAQHCPLLVRHHLSQ